MTMLDLEDASPQDILRWALREYAGSIALACSFGGPTGIVALDMALAIDPDVPVYYLDTGLLFAETLALIERVKRRYSVVPIAVQSELSLEAQERRHGPALWERDPDRCCTIRKLEPQAAFLRGYTAWISGIRRDQTASRASVPAVQRGDRFGLVKVNPFAAWDERMVWAYIRAHDLPYNALHERSFPSIGCTHCTRAVVAGEPARAGRWPLTAKLECGLHA